MQVLKSKLHRLNRRAKSLVASVAKMNDFVLVRVEKRRGQTVRVGNLLFDGYGLQGLSENFKFKLSPEEPALSLSNGDV